MKRTVLVLVVVALACTFAVSQALARPAPPDHAGALRVHLQATEDAPEGARGFAAINEDDEGNYAVTVHVFGLEANQTVA